jgi:hypothetical protein
MQDVRSADCARMSSLDRKTLTTDKDEVEDYWLRLDPTLVRQSVPLTTGTLRSGRS